MQFLFIFEKRCINKYKLMKNKIILVLLLFSVISCRQREEIPLPEHPRPDFRRYVWQNLNGYWHFRPDPDDLGFSENWQTLTDSFKQKILVPFSWAAPHSELEMPDTDIGWYYRTFKIENPAKWKEMDTWLVFCASDFNTTVWINGVEAGSHSGGYVPFDFNITSALEQGENYLVVRVEDRELDNRPSGKQYYGNAKGIWQTVYIEGRPENYISGIKFIPDIDSEEVEVEIALAKKAGTNMDFFLKGINNDMEYQAEIPVNRTNAKFTFPVYNMKLWNLDDPYLYEVTASVSGKNYRDDVSGYFGMRKISSVNIPGKDFQYVALNNEPVYLKLSLDQSYHPAGFYTFPSDQFMKEEIIRAKDLGLNGLRIHIKAEIPRKLYWADKLGLLIQEDIPNYWGEPDSIAKANWEYIAENEVERDFNHPCIFSWVLFNETWGLFSTDSTGKRSYTQETQDWVRSWYYKIREYDPTRLVEDNSPCNMDHVITDINTWHRYLPARQWKGFLDMVVENTYPGSGFNYIGDNVQGNEPMFNSECGAVWGYKGSTGDIDITWEYHIMMNEFRKRPSIAGFLFTEFHDVINEWNGYYRFDRTKKVFGLDELNPGMTMKDFHKDLYVVAGEDFYNIYKGGNEIKIPVGISAVTNDIPEKLIINYSLSGWDGMGQKSEYSSGSLETSARPFTFSPLDSVVIRTPEKTAVMIFSTTLEDGSGNVLQRNFFPFRVTGNEISGDKFVVTQSPSEYSAASWSIKHFEPQDGKKVWGMGSGYFEYQFSLSDNIDKTEIESIEFRAELASRYPQPKYLNEGEAERIGMKVVSEKGTIPGYGQNSYPQTDEKLHRSVVKITANDQNIAEVELQDDPADHRGILSWMNQKPGRDWGNSDRSIPWLLDEPGSYGYLVKATLDEISEKSALESGLITIRLYVDETSSDRGGLSIYGKESGRFPMDLTIVLKEKE